MYWRTLDLDWQGYNVVFFLLKKNIHIIKNPFDFSVYVHKQVPKLFLKNIVNMME